ncbi:MAG: CapA family protein [Acidimicrobiales bacterium]
MRSNNDRPISRGRLSLIGLALAAASCGGTGDLTVSQSQVGTTVAPATTSATSWSTTSTANSTTTASTTTTTASTTTTTEPPRSPIVVAVAGDTSFTNGLDQRDPLGQVAELLSAPDLMIVNLETSVADPDVGRVAVDKPFLFKSPPASLQLLVDAGVDVVGLANNHTLDFGPDALEQTLREVDAAGLARVGAGVDEADAYRTLVVDVEGWKVGVVSLSRVPCDWSASGENVRPQVAWACPAFLDQADAMVSDTVAAADVTVVMVHGGEEGVLCPSSFMVELSERWAAAGVDAIVNGHPHVVQGLTIIGDTLVARSSGNFAFPSARGITANSAIFSFTVTEAADGAPELALRVEPVRVDHGVARPPSESERAGIIEQIAGHSSGVQIAADGSVVADPEQRGRCD